jgi:hypothetical protein
MSFAAQFYELTVMLDCAILSVDNALNDCDNVGRVRRGCSDRWFG